MHSLAISRLLTRLIQVDPIETSDESSSEDSSSVLVKRTFEDYEVPEETVNALYTVKATIIIPLIQSGQAKPRKHQFLIQKIPLQKIQRTSRCL